MANPDVESKYYEKGFKAKVTIPEAGQGEISFVDEAKTAYLEGFEAKPSFAKYKYEADGPGSKGPAAR